MDRYSKEGDLSSSVFAVSRRWDFVENKSWNCVSGEYFLWELEL